MTQNELETSPHHVVGRCLLILQISFIVTNVLGSCQKEAVQVRSTETIPIDSIVHVKANRFSIAYTADSLYIEYNFVNDQLFDIAFSPTVVALFDGDSIASRGMGFNLDAFVTQLYVESEAKQSVQETLVGWAIFRAPDEMEYQFVMVPSHDSITVCYAIPIRFGVYQSFRRRKLVNLSVAMWRASDLCTRLGISLISIRKVVLNDTCCPYKYMSSTDFLARTNQWVSTAKLSSHDVYDLEKLIRYRLQGSTRPKNVSVKASHE